MIRTAAIPGHPFGIHLLACPSTAATCYWVPLLLGLLPGTPSGVLIQPSIHHRLGAALRIIYTFLFLSEVHRWLDPGAPETNFANNFRGTYISLSLYCLIGAAAWGGPPTLGCARL